MNKSTFKVSKMDCPSEEQMIRLRLQDQSNIKEIEFDIPNRLVNIYHTGEYEEIQSKLNSLNLDTSFISNDEATGYISRGNHHQERKLLWQVLVINFSFFVLEIIVGFISNSMGLVADSLDMLADSLVYGLALFAVGGTLLRKKNIANAGGYFQLILALFGFAEVIRRFIGNEEMPAFQIMIIISLLALIGNALCLYLLQKSKSKEVHMQASMVFTSNDVIVNIGVAVAGGFVYLTNSQYPDLIIGTIVFILVGRGAFGILKLS